MSTAKVDNDPRASITPLQQMVSSCSGALVTSLLVTPLDVIKIRLQAQAKPLAPGTKFLYCNGLMDHVCLCRANGGNGGTGGKGGSKQWMNRPCGYTRFNGTWVASAGREAYMTGTLDAMRKIVQYEGVTSLWSGLPPTLVMAVPATVIYFTAYDQIKYALGYNESDPATRYVPLLAGVIARTGAVVVISPLELVRTAMQAQQQSYGQLGASVAATLRQSGIRGLTRGLGPTLLRDVPFSALYWFGYEWLKARQMRGSGRRVPLFREAFVAGALSGSFAALVTLPFDVIKTHRQIELGKDNGKASTSTWRLIGQLYQKNGVRALFAGTVPRLVKVAPACAIMISSYEFSKSFFRTYNQQHQQQGKAWGGSLDK